MYLIGIDPTRTSSTQEHPLGSLALRRESSGENSIYQYVKMDGTGLTGVGYVVIISGGTGVSGNTASMTHVNNTQPGTGQGKKAGVGLGTVAANEYCWVKVWGDALIRVAASCAIFTRLNSTSNNGQLDDDASTGAEVIEGIVIRSSPGGSAGSVNGIINWPYVGATI